MTTLSREEAFEKVMNVQRGVSGNAEVIGIYKTWDDYDEILDNVDYNGPLLGARYLHKHLNKKGFKLDCEILDVGAGTGKVTKHLKNYGYFNVDAADASAEMLQKAKTKNLYRNISCCYFGDGQKLPMSDNSYDAAVMVGCFTVGHVKCDALLEMIRVVKPGGFVVQVMREENTRKQEEYRQLLPLCQKWIEEGLWRRVEETVPDDLPFYMDLPALVQVYQVLK